MAYVPPEILKCVVFLGYINEESKERFAGSAFWISRHGPSGAQNGERLEYLVTAAHVIDTVQRAASNKRVRIRLNLKEDKQDWIDTPLACWKFHPQYPKVDLAVMKIDVAAVWDHLAWPAEYCATKDSLDTGLKRQKARIG